MIFGTKHRLVISYQITVLVAGSGSKAEQTQIVEAFATAKEHPWSAIGKLTSGTIGACTAVLIGQHYALTAAHCLFMKRTRRFLPAESLHLILGYENQNFADHLHVLAYFVPPTYDQ